MFITFEGGEKAGKTTQIALLRDRLTEAGYRVLLTREPGGASVSERIRELLLSPDNTEMRPLTEALLYAAVLWMDCALSARNTTNIISIMALA